MSWQFTVLWLVVGFIYPFYFFPWRWIPDPPPPTEGKPQPEPWRSVIGAVGGVIGGWAFYSTWVAQGTISGVEAASTVVGSVLGAGLLLSVYSLATRIRTPRA